MMWNVGKGHGRNRLQKVFGENGIGIKRFTVGLRAVHELKAYPGRLRCNFRSLTSYELCTPVICPWGDYNKYCESKIRYTDIPLSVVPTSFLPRIPRH